MYTTFQFVKHETKKNYTTAVVTFLTTYKVITAITKKENPVACYNPELTKGNKYSKKKNIYIYNVYIYILVTKRSKCPKPEISFP